LELLHPSWADDEVYERIHAHGVNLVATDLDGHDEPVLRHTGSLVYLRLRRPSYGEADMARWVRRLRPFLADGIDAYVFFRHDDDGQMALNAETLLTRAAEVMGS
jgi:uncharacterized protein YecE (DUF72 family)